MKIVLQTPFKEIWKHGYLVTNRENRKHVILYNSIDDRTTISYARYLMTVELGDWIPWYMEVDHKDNDKTNDTIENLQVLSPEENKKKSARKPAGIHGTLTAARYCKCELCKKAKSDYAKAYYRRNKQS